MSTFHSSRKRYGDDPIDSLDLVVCDLVGADETLWESPIYLIPMRGKEWYALGLRETDFDTIE